MGSSKLNELAVKLNSMKNPSRIGVSIGKVVKTKPLSISIADGAAILVEGEELYVCDSLKEQTYDSSEWEWSGGTLEASVTGSTSPEGESVTGSVTGATSGKEKGSIKVDPHITKGDMILVVPMVDEQIWIAVDRIKEE